MRPETARRLARNDTPKGDVLASARIAGILAAKRTPELIPLCHHVAVTSVEVALDLEPASGTLSVTATVEAMDRTGVEMEALTAVSVACLTIYDMLKGIDRDMIVSDIRLVTKTGGKTGPYVRRDR
jgi:cyclic pyranopterin phosphate synthase